MTAIDELYNAAINQNCNIKKNVDLSAYTSFKIGGPADLLVKPDSDCKTVSLLKKCRELELKFLILGKGSNVLIADEGFKGVVFCTSELDHSNYSGNGIIECGSGISLNKLCNIALDYSLSGLEFASGIPGTAGGAVYMNAGAYGSEMKDILIKSYHITQNFCFESFENQEIIFGYRSSIYSKNGFFITGLKIQLHEENKKMIKERMNEINLLRRQKQPLEFPSAGSTFKRPDGYFAGALIEECGLKGLSVGGAAVSEKHAGFIINKEQATAYDVLKLIEIVQETVFRKKGIYLETEIKYIN